MENKTKTIEQQIKKLNYSIYNAILSGDYELLEVDDDYKPHSFLFTIKLNDSGLKLDVCINNKDKLIYIDGYEKVVLGMLDFYNIPDGKNRNFAGFRKSFYDKVYNNKIKEMEKEKSDLEYKILEINDRIENYKKLHNR